MGLLVQMDPNDLEVKPSQIVGAGDGLYTKKGILAHDFIGTYTAKNTIFNLNLEIYPRVV